MLSPYGHHFERSAVEEWLRAHRTCPITRAPLEAADLLPPSADLLLRLAGARTPRTPAARSPATAEEAEQPTTPLVAEFILRRDSEDAADAPSAQAAGAAADGSSGTGIGRARDSEVQAANGLGAAGGAASGAANLNGRYALDGGSSGGPAPGGGDDSGLEGTVRAGLANRPGAGPTRSVRESGAAAPAAGASGAGWRRAGSGGSYSV